MCGIVGAVSWERASEELRAAEAVMRRAVAHRGPDGEGGFADENVALGHRRLSIIDLDGGAQPMLEERRRFVLVCNGEIYNHRQLRCRLASRHRFATRSDSEVLVHLIEERGEDFPDQLDGMYAYAIWDRTERALHLGVDRFGVKPLYYAERGGTLVFASELRALAAGLRALGYTPALDVSAADIYLRLGWFPRRTAMAGVRKLAPGERLRFGRDGVRLSGERPGDRLGAPDGNAALAWPPVAGHANGPTDDDTRAVRKSEATDRIETALRAAVRRQMISDVPVGVLLSGGIDSSLVAALACVEAPGLDTFTISFQGRGREVAEASEAAYARALARSIGARYHELPLGDADLVALLDESLVAMDEPIADAAVVPLLALARFASSHVKVCLGGDGGDELFGGYLRHVLIPLKNAVHGYGRGWARALSAVSRIAPRRTSGGRGLTVARRAGVLAELLADPAYVTGPFSGSYATFLAHGMRRVQETAYHPAPEGRLRAYDLAGQLWGQHLQKTDRIAMWTGLEVRVPFLDPGLHAVATSLDRRDLVRGLTTKAALRRVAARHVPRAIARRPKHGFRVPLNGWIRGPLRERIGDVLGGTSTRLPSDLIEGDRLERLVADHLSGRSEHGIRIWALLALDDWMRRTLPS